MYFLKRKTQQKSETENEAERQKREKKSWAKPNLSQVIIACGFSNLKSKKVFLFVFDLEISSRNLYYQETQKKKNSHISQIMYLARV